MMRKVLILLCAQALFVATNAEALVPVYSLGGYEETTKTWTMVYERLVDKGTSVKGTTYIVPLKGNGYRDRRHKNNSRDTIIFIPNTVSIEEPVDIIFYFHGLGGFKKRDFETRVLKHTPSIDPERNYIVVIPEMPWSKHTSTPRTRQGRVFNKKGQFSEFVLSVKHVIGTHFMPPCKRTCPILKPKISVNLITLLGHSAGGSTLMSISKSGGLNWLYNEAGVKSVKIIFSDASYGYWLDITWKSFRPYVQGTEFLVLTRKWDRPHRHTKRFLNKFKKPPVNIKHIVFSRKTTHAGIGDQSFTWIYGPAVDSGCGEGEKNE